MAKLPQNTYRTARGAQIDMLKIINQNEMTIAAGNMGVNARGDKLGSGGKVVKKREEIVGNAAVPNQVSATQTTTKNIKDMDPEGDE